MHNNIPTARVITLTPAMASEFLARNPRNRRIRPRNYAVVLRAITNGEWKLNGEAIKIAPNGFILDGQHRCLAVVESGISIQTFVIDGLPPETQDTMDGGQIRTLPDILDIHGYQNVAALASIIRRIYIASQWGLKAAAMSNYPTTRNEMVAFFESNRWIESLVSEAAQIGKFAKMPGSLVGLLMHTFQTIDRTDADFFFDKLKTGENLATDNPIYVLRRSLQILHDGKGTVNQTYLTAITVKAWNRFREGGPVGGLKWTGGGANPEKFPEPK